MDSALDWHAARALLDWQIEAGVTEAIAEAPVDRFAADAARVADRAAAAATAATTPEAPHVPGAAAPPKPEVDPVAEAERAAGAAQDLAGLRAAMETFEHCELRRGARSLVFADGDPAARVAIVGEAPGRDEDLEGRPFVGRAGRLLDKMLDAIDMGRDRDGADAVYITNVMPWRPPQNRDPRPEEIAMMLPFLRRHLDLARPEIVVIVGNTSAQALLGKRGILRLRGKWTEALGRPALPMLHPAYLLRNPEAKRDAWADLLALRARLRDMGT
ncbi:phage SPO1 DNA polymerase-related protein [Roseivivax marinus]|uniref:Type-4 uracil-DNA glycosylase n=1 Tax=Roseivivax marinus TaxID=1379903 RepID=W4HPH0_9RHOB|nr:uracil-DNA glycosylase [Roseivivax marinus]ETW13870.1 phage SPO1 DNA polymerase-related protein [Roseivivax marinus]UMA63852.1 uracil-DNA glycosylase [Roseivivax marinus]SEK87365.1 DNA polymerase [Roseivivax marinus]